MKMEMRMQSNQPMENTKVSFGLKVVDYVS